MDLPWIRDRLPETLSALGRRTAARAAGPGGTHAPWAALEPGAAADPEALAYAREAGSRELSGWRRRCLLGALEAAVVEAATGAARSRLADHERSGTASARAPRDLVRALRRAPPPGERRRLSDELMRAAEPLQAPFVRLVEQLAGRGREVAPPIGAPGPEPLEALRLAGDLLDATEDGFAEVAAWMLRDLQLQPAEGLPALLALLRQLPADLDYPAAGGLVEAGRVLEHLGLPRPAIHDPGAGGWPFARVLALDPPGRVEVTLPGEGGLPGHLAALVALPTGGALRAPGIDEPPEARVAQGLLVPGIAGELAGALVARRSWLVRRLSVPRVRLVDQLRRGAFVRTLRARLQAGQVLAEAVLLGHGPGREPLAEAARLLRRAAGVELPEALVPLACRLDGVAAAQLAASAWAAELEPRLLERCDEDWFRNPATAAVFGKALGRGRAGGPEVLLAAVHGEAPEASVESDGAALARRLLDGL